MENIWSSTNRPRSVHIPSKGFSRLEIYCSRTEWCMKKPGFSSVTPAFETITASVADPVLQPVTCFYVNYFPKGISSDCKDDWTEHVFSTSSSKQMSWSHQFRSRALAKCHNVKRHMITANLVISSHELITIMVYGALKGTCPLFSHASCLFGP